MNQTKEQVKHTQLPWGNKHSDILNPNDEQLATTSYSECDPITNQANAEFICKAVNSHYELLEACKEMLQCVCDYNEGKDTEVNDWIKSWSQAIAKAEDR